MRNLKIGAKLILGFGVVLLMMVVIVVTVIISNTTTLDNVDNIDLGSELQVKTNALTARFNDARISANTLYDIISDEAYESFCDYIDECEVILSDIYDHISQYPILDRFRPQFQSFEESMLKWRAEIDNVQRDNDAISVIDAEFTTVGTALNAVNSKALSDQLALLRAEAAGELSEDALTDRADRIEFAQSIQSEIFAIRMKARVMMDLFDTSEYESLVAMVDDALKNTNDYKSLARQQANKDTAQEIIDALELYRECIMKFVTKIDESESTMGAAKPIGLLAVDSLSDIVTDIDDAMDSRVKSTISSVTLSLILVISISVLSIIVSVVLALVITSGITKPLNHMRDFLVQIGTTGNLAMDSQAQENAAQESKSKDEVGQCSVAMLAFLNHLADVSKTLDSVADGDLTVEVKLLSEKDSMGLAVGKMVKNLGEMFCEINESSNMVSAGAKQMADGAQSLAQGSTEQAAAVEQLSSSISQVAEQTRDNADMSSRAASLADTIRQSAEKESHQMGQMLKAVKEIGEASQNIGKVIKAINDIAFQTNILALNAAVEAARAGQHGKGFAVVAEEVRSLAAKSADAAKNTESLIANSIEKAELGAHIAEETSASLAEIVSEISDSSRIIGDIAKSSSEQTASINQINEGINQVAQVVQQNSATAEESAAASEEISGQSAMLQELISRFKLNDAGAHHIDYYTESSPKASMPLMPHHPYKPDIIMPEKY